MATANNVVTPTVTIPYTPSVDPLGHNLIKTYLGYSPSISQIYVNIEAEFNTLVSGYPNVRFMTTVHYNHVDWHAKIGSGIFPEGRPEMYQYWTVAPYDLSQFVKVEGDGILSQAKAVALANGKKCYDLAVPGIKSAQLSLPAGSYQWAWFTMGYPNNYGCWDMISGHPSTDYRYGAWWSYGGDLAHNGEQLAA